MKKQGLLCAIAVLAFFPISATSQTLISGVINDYTNVTAINVASISITVSDASAFSPGDRVLLIQMKGASIDETNTASFGTISTYNNAGNYEFHTICSISGFDIFLTHEFVNTYTVSQPVQLVRVPVYTDATISGGDLTADPWDGTVGGILAFEVTGTLDFGTQNIDVEGLGFRGGVAELSGGGCSGIVLDDTYYSNITDADEKGRKGEGITEIILTKECGRGPQANGGGGGNNHNAGGCGGGNYAAGGAGGKRVKASAFTCGSLPGIESKDLSAGYGMDKIFLGGGGGAGHGNNTGFTSEQGADGGGIVIIRAGTLNGNGQLIDADGAQHTVNAANEGGGGAGGAGAVLLKVGSYGTPLNVDVEGGNGTDIDNVGTSNCNGPGGGGGGGVVWASGSSFPTSITASTSGGIAGVINTTSQPTCVLGSNNEATDGLAGATLADLVLIEGTVVASTGSTTETACNSYTVPSGDETYTTSGIYTDTLANSMGCDSVVTIDLTINTVDTSITESSTMLTANATGAVYQWIDCNTLTDIPGETNQDFSPLSTGDYAVIVTENGCTDTSGCHHFEPIGFDESPLQSQIRLYPNPTKEGVQINLGKPYKDIQVDLQDLTGRIVAQYRFVNKQLVFLEIEAAAALYFIRIEADEDRAIKRLVKK